MKRREVATGLAGDWAGHRLSHPAYVEKYADRHPGVRRRGPTRLGIPRGGYRPRRPRRVIFQGEVESNSDRSRSSSSYNPRKVLQSAVSTDFMRLGENPRLRTGRGRPADAGSAGSALIAVAAVLSTASAINATLNGSAPMSYTIAASRVSAAMKN